MSRNRTALSLMTLALVIAPMAHADELTADAILDKALNKGNVLGFNQGTATLSMTITKDGVAKNRTLEIKALRENQLMKSMVKFSKPAEVAGISFLVIEKKDALPDQYVYVPAAKVVRRVAAGNASSSFFDSDFSYVDLMPLPPSQRDKAKMTRLPDADVGGQPAYVIEAVLNVEGAPYGKLITYLHKEHLTPLKVEFFDGKLAPLKTLKVKKLKKVKGELVPVEVTMKSEVAKTETHLVITDINPDAKLSASDFTEEAMQR